MSGSIGELVRVARFQSSRGSHGAGRPGSPITQQSARRTLSQSLPPGQVASSLAAVTPALSLRHSGCTHHDAHPAVLPFGAAAWIPGSSCLQVTVRMIRILSPP